MKDIPHLNADFQRIARRGKKAFLNGHWASLVVQRLKRLPAVWETWVQSLGGEEPLEKGMNPLQYPCLENPIDRGPWWATVHGVAESRTRPSD